MSVFNIFNFVFVFMEGEIGDRRESGKDGREGGRGRERERDGGSERERERA